MDGRCYVALLDGNSVDCVTATKLQVLQAVMQAAAKNVLWFTAGGVWVGFWKENRNKDRHMIFFTPHKLRREWRKWFLEGALAEVGESHGLQRCYRSKFQK